MIVLLSISLTIGGSKAPPLGSFFHPTKGFWNNAQPLESLRDQTIQLALPSGKSVTVVFDERLVPHIFGSNDVDVYFAQGYITGMHRLFQMDISARATEGRLSEFLGSRTIEYDRSQRRLGLAKAAEQTDEIWAQNAEMYQNLKQYAAGINAYIETLSPADYPIEYKILNFSPEEWSPYRTALFAKSMANVLCSSQKDLEFTNTLNIFGRESFDVIAPAYNPKQSPIIPAGTKWDFNSVAVQNRIQIPVGDLPSGSFEENDENFLYGSNNWAVGGSKTPHGKPILCSDPHLRLTLPSIWYESHIITPEYNCYGVSLPGFPGITIGFNEHIAWGITNAGHDVMDWYQIDWIDEEKGTYWLDGKAENATMRIEEIRVRDQETVTDTIWYTKWGPAHEDGKYQGLAMQWLPLEAIGAHEPQTFFDLNRAKNHEDYLNALENYISPAQNFVFASTSGDIAIKVGGKLPLRSAEQGKFVQSGSHSQNGWQGYIPSEHNPHVLNPTRAFVSSANQNSTDLSYPYYYNGDPYFEDYRGRRLNDLLEQQEIFSAEDMKKIQLDNYSLKAAEILPTLLAYLDRVNGPVVNSVMAVEVLNSLKKWNYAYEWDSKAPIYFDVWYRQFYNQTWDEVISLRDSTSVISPKSWRTIELAQNEPNHKFFDQLYSEDRVEQLQDIVLLSFQDMLRDIEDLPASRLKNWGAYKRTSISHLAQIPVFSRSLPGASGTNGVLNATGSTTGPSWRMIVEMTTPVKAQVVYPGGQSGDPSSPYFDNMVDAWKDGKYYQAHFVKTPEELNSLKLYTLKLTQ